MTDKLFTGLPHSLIGGQRLTVGASAILSVEPAENLAGCMVQALSWETTGVGLLLELRINWEVFARNVELGTGGRWDFGRAVCVAPAPGSAIAQLTNQTASTIYVRALNLWALNI